MRTTIAEMEYEKVKGRDARIEKIGDDHYVVLDDAGYGTHRRWVTDTEAEELIALGLRDARNETPTLDDDDDE